MKKKMPKIARELEAAGHKVTDLSKQGVKSIGFVGGVPACRGFRFTEGGPKDRPCPKRNQPSC